MSIDLDIRGNTKPLEASVQAAINRIRRQPIKITVDDKGATQPLGNMKRGADEFGKSMEAANARIIAFGASMAIINGVSDAFKGMVKNMIEVEKAMADINVVMGLSSKNLDKFSDGLFKVAKETGAAFNVAAQAATEYARQGLAVEESLKRTKDALILTRLTGMDSANAVKSLTAAMNTYGDQIKDTTQLVSKFAAVDVQFAVSAEDFADAIARTGAAAKGAGVDIDELIGLVTAAQQQTARGGKVIGNSLKTIFTRVGRTDTLNQLENLGIAVRDIEGKTLGAKRILTDLANTFDKLSEAQKAQIAQTVGGVFQINVLKAVLGDAAKQNGILSNATQIAAGATDEAIKKNEQLRNTMSAMASETGNSIKQVSAQIGEIMLAPGMEKILNTVKSFAETASGVLGDGESTGNKFATGFLRGLGNIITGPGLVVLTTVFVKLFAQAFKFTKESLNSLIGITTQAQKQKAIQTSLVTLVGQNAQLSKEILRTDVSRTQKEQMILGLIKAQVSEAKVLNDVARQTASSLYKQGYGPGLTKRRGKAEGHIPNFSERQQAAKGGYAAGNIRSMDMPGQGSIIYNSAEKVKNFAGMKQPAIMPPQSSKAGGNYQKAFSEVHGFDPYKANGYIPNFSKQQTSKAGDKSKLGTIGQNIDLSAHAKDLAILFGYGGEGVSSKPYSQKFNTMGGPSYNKQTGHNASANSTLSRYLFQKNPKFASSFGAGQQGLEKFHKNLFAANPNVSVTMESKAISPVSNSDTLSAKEINELGDARLKGMMKDPLNAAMKKIAQNVASPFLPETGDLGAEMTDIWEKNSADAKANDVIGTLSEMAIRGALDVVAGEAVDGGKAGAPFDFTGSHAQKISEFFNNGKKYTAIEMKLRGSSAAGKDGGIPKKVLNKKFAANGYIPNFANPLADAISRERQAGVPVSQIRVDSHPALVNKSNPVGLGVTNTKDEPNGLKDVFGAKGFVPNYAMPGMIKDIFSGLKGDATVEDYNTQMEKTRASMAKHDAEIKKLTEHKRRYSSISQSAYASERTKTEATRRAAAAENKLTTAKTARAQAETQLTQQSRQRRGAQVRGNAGMTAILGLPMAASYLQADGPGQTGAGAAMYGAGGALQGAASTGYMASMIAPFFGPAAPLVVVAGALYGAFDGWNSAMDENTKALTEKQKEIITSQTQNSAQSISQIMQGEELSRTLSGANLDSTAKRLGLGGEATVRDALNKASFGMTPLRAGEGKLKNISEEELAKFSELVKLRTLERGENTKSLFETGGAPDTRISQTYNEHGASQQIKVASDEMNIYTKVAKELGYTDGQGQAMMPQTFRGSLISQKKSARESFPELLDFVLKNENSEYLAYGEQKFSKEEYRKLMLGKQAVTSEGQQADILSEEARSKAVQTQGEKIYTDFVNAKQKELDGVIVEIDKAKALREIKKRTFNAEMKIKQDALTRSNLYLVETELQKKFLSEKEVAQLKYNHALDEAADSLKSAQITAEGELRQQITNVAINDSALRANLADSLGVQGEKLSGSTTKAEITSSMYDIPIKDLLAAIEEYESKAGDTAAADGQTEAVRALAEGYRQTNRELNAGNDLKVTGIELENKRNQILSDRNRIIRENSDALRAYNQETEHRDKIRGFQSQQKDAEILASGEYQTREMVAQRAVNELPETVQNIRRGYTGQVKEQLGGLGLDQDLQEEYFMQGTSLRDLTSKQTQKELAGIDSRLLDNTTKRESIVGKGNDATKAETEELKKLKEENKALEQSKDKILEKSEKHKQLISETEKEIQRLIEQEREHVKAIEDGAKARLKQLKDMQGPGSMGKGFERGIDKMNEKVKFMDYELGQRIPENLANGLADAMGSALDGTKKLDDALMDVAVNFLGMIQQAFLQKAAYQIVGAMGGGMSVGGGVRNYSSGGTVPAMVSNGEYLMNRDAVSKYGGSFMHNLNNGRMPAKYHQGGSVGDFFEPKPKSVSDFFSEPSQGFRSSKNNSAAIRRAINDGPSSSRDFSSAIKGSDKFSSGRSPTSDITDSIKGGYENGKNFFSDIATGLGDIFSMISSPFKAVGSFLGIPGFNEGGGVNETQEELPKGDVGSALRAKFGGGRGIESGRLYQRKKMSSHFYSQSGNVGVQEDKGEMVDVLRKEEIARQEAARRRAAKKARRKALLARVVGTVVSYGLSQGLESLAESGALGEKAMINSWANSSDTSISDAKQLQIENPGMTSGEAMQAVQPYEYDFDVGSVPDYGKKIASSRGGKINGYSYGGTPSLKPSLRPDIIDAQISSNEEVQKKNAGGWISGKSGIDQIPAMLSNGEYVIKASSARKIGRSNLDRINAGKYNEGGSVDDTPSNSPFEESSNSSGGNTNNINITVNVEKGSVKEESSSQEKNDPASNSEKQKQNQELAERVKQQVLSVIVEEQRPGGLLDSAE